MQFSATGAAARPAAAAGAVGAGMLGTFFHGRRQQQVSVDASLVQNDRIIFEEIEDWGVISSRPVSRDEVSGAIRELVLLGGGAPRGHSARAGGAGGGGAVGQPRRLSLLDGPIVEEIFSDDEGSVGGGRSGWRASGGAAGIVSGPESVTTEGSSIDLAMAQAEAYPSEDPADRVARWAADEYGYDGAGGYSRSSGAAAAGHVSRDRWVGDGSAASAATQWQRGGGVAAAPVAAVAGADSATLDLVGSMLTNLLSNPVVMGSIQRELAADPAYHALLARAQPPGSRAGLLPPAADALLSLPATDAPGLAQGERGARRAAPSLAAASPVAPTLYDVLDGVLKGVGRLALAVGEGFAHIGSVLRVLGDGLREALAGLAPPTPSAAAGPAGAASAEDRAARTQAALARAATAVAVIVLLRRVAPTLL